MTDQSDFTAPTLKKKRHWALIITAVILLIGIAGFIASRAGIDKLLVKQKLDDVIAQIKENGRNQGRDIDITYGDLEVVGSFASKHVVVHNPAFYVKPMNQKPLQPGEQHKPDSLVVTTPTLEIYPEAADLSSLRLQLPEPINFAAQDAPEKSLLKLSANTPFAVSFTQETVNNVPHTKVKYVSPTELDYTFLREQQAEGAEEKTPDLVPVYDTLHVAIAAGSGLESDFATDGSELGTAKIHFGNVVSTPQSAPEGAVAIAAMEGEWSNVLNEKKQNVIHSTLNLGPITGGILPYAPIAIAMDVTYTGTLLKTPESVAEAKSQESAIDVKTFSITTKDSSFTVTGNFTADASDILPVGKANIAIVNMPFILGELRTNAILNPNNEPIVAPLLQLMTGSPLDQLKDTNIAIERARGGAFKIGQTTFEELFATFLKQAMAQKQGAAAPATPAAPNVITPTTPNAHAPTLPPADKPKPKPLEVPDHGTRG